MRRRVVRFEMSPRLHNAKASLGHQGEALMQAKRAAAQNVPPFPSSVRSADSFPLRGSLGFSQTRVCAAPLPPPLGEVSERSEGRRGSATTIPTLSVSFADSSPKGRAKALLQIAVAAKNREKVITLSRLIHSASSVFFIIVCSGLCLAARKFQIRPNTRGFR